MESTLVGVAIVLTGVAWGVFRLAGLTSTRPGGDASRLVRVTGQVISQHRVTLRWTIRYPLPDGSPSEFLVERTTRPMRLREGMAVSVLVDPADPHRARLDMPQRTAFIRIILIGVAVAFVAPLLVGGIIVLLFSRN